MRCGIAQAFCHWGLSSQPLFTFTYFSHPRLMQYFCRLRRPSEGATTIPFPCLQLTALSWPGACKAGGPWSLYSAVVSGGRHSAGRRPPRLALLLYMTRSSPYASFLGTLQVSLCCCNNRGRASGQRGPAPFIAPAPRQPTGALLPLALLPYPTPIPLISPECTLTDRFPCLLLPSPCSTSHSGRTATFASPVRSLRMPPPVEHRPSRLASLLQGSDLARSAWCLALDGMCRARLRRR